MATKIKKKPETGGVDAPDQVMTTLATTYGWLGKYKLHIVILVGAVFAVLLAISGIASLLESRTAARGAEFEEAFKVTRATVGEEKPANSKDLHFNTVAEKNDAFASKLADFVEQYKDTDIALAASIELGAVQVEQGKNDEAMANLTLGTNNEAYASFEVVIVERLGIAALQAGKIEEAQTHFQAMKEKATAPVLKARATIHLGDMANPLVTSVAGTKSRDKAEALYKEALELVKEPEGGEDVDTLRQLILRDRTPAQAVREAVDFRLAMLKAS